MTGGARAPDARSSGDAPRWLYAPNGRLRAVWRLALYGLALVAGSYVASGFLYPALLPLAKLFTVRPALQDWLNLAAVAIAHLIVLRVDRLPFAYVALGRDAARRALLLGGAALGALAIGVPTAVLLLAGAFRAEPQPDGPSLAAGWGLVAEKLAPAALFEELLVRGYPFMVLREAAGAPLALLLTSAVFGVLHWTNPGATVGSVLIVTLAGLFLGGVLLATRSLWAAWTAHLAWNATLGAVFHAAISGLAVPTPDYRVVDAGPDWLTGGVWGPEGGAGAAAGMSAAILYLWWRARRAARPTDPLAARPDGRGSA